MTANGEGGKDSTRGALAVSFGKGERGRAYDGVLGVWRWRLWRMNTVVGGEVLEDYFLKLYKIFRIIRILF